VMHARRHALQHLDEIAEVQALPKLSVKLTVAQVLGGLLLLMAAAQFVVYGGRGIAALLGWSPFIVGAVVVAVATGTPELATTIVARAKGHHDVGLGAILGSNVFNALIIASVAAFIRPYGVRREEILPSIAFGIVTVLLVCPGKGGALGRWRGAVLLGVYALYIALTLRSGGH
jgi:cation:H+ antiporter